MGWLIPESDPRQAVRVRRLLMGAGSYLLPAAGMAYALLRGTGGPPLRPSGAALWLGTVVTANLAFFTLIRSGLSKRFHDPALTIPQMTVAVLLVTWMLYFAGSARGAMSMLYLVTFTFGLFRLTTRDFLWLSGFTLLCYGVMIATLLPRHPASAEVEGLLVDLVVVATVLPWFALVGGYISRLRERLNRANNRLEEALDTIGRLAIYDELTQVYNRRHLLEILDRQKELADRGGWRFAVALIDLDHFKQVNDTLGHLAGDDVLAGVAAAVNGTLRSVDAMARYGGEEFVLVLSNTDLDGARRAADRVHRRIARASFEELGVRQRITVSIGVTAYAPPEELAALLARADRALYEAKAAGRNCTRTADPPVWPRAAARGPAAGGEDGSTP
ncbi:MAG TPA: diguanylate cyclase [Gammaproteobacteria bacterium]|nr:diguanylate cyclase [Gammaproteobacteria bacterium]